MLPLKVSSDRQWRQATINTTKSPSKKALPKPLEERTTSDLMTLANQSDQAALKSLATVRRLPLPAVQVNIWEKQVNIAQAGSTQMNMEAANHPVQAVQE